MIVPFLLVAALPQVQRGPLTLAPAITVITPRPRVDASTAFKLSGTVAAGVTWDFGDGTPSQAGGSTISHLYRSAGTFAVKATVGGTLFQQSITVVEPRRVVVTPAAPTPGKPATLRFEEPFGTTFQWNFGDGSAPINGRATISHTFAKEGSYTVKVRDTGTESPREFQLDVPVGLQGPGAPFSISYLALRWEDGTQERSVRQGESGLVAYADLKFEGTGQLQAEWVVDGQVQRAISQQLGFAKLTTLQSGETIASPLSTRVLAAQREGRHTLASTVAGEFQINLPTNVAGEHRVTLNVLQPKLAFQVPVIRYFVKLAGEAQGPLVQSVSPAAVKPGEEADLILTGTGFTADMTLNLGKDVAIVGVPQILSPEKAMVKVFIAPTAQGGTRLFQARKSGGSPAGTAHLEIISPTKVAGALSTKAAVTPAAVVSPGISAPSTQPMQGRLPDGKTPAGKVLATEPAKLGGLGLAKAEDKGKKRLPVLQTPMAFRSASVDLVKVSKVGSGFSRLVVPAGGKGVGAILDATAGQRKEKVLVCKEGQKLGLSKVALASPSFSLIGVNTSGEFQSDDLPVLRDATQFAWKEKNPSTSEYFELRFFNAKDGKLLKTLRIPGNRTTFDVTPAFVQELGSLRGAHGIPSLADQNGKGVAASRAGKVPGTSSGTPKAGAGASGMTTKSFKASATLPSSGITTSKSANTSVITAPTMANLPTIAPDPDIPAKMREKADVVWQVVGFRSYPCLSQEDFKAQTLDPKLVVPNGNGLLHRNQPLAAGNPTPAVLSATPATPKPGSLQLATASALTTKRGVLPAKTAGSGPTSAVGHSPALDKPLGDQGQAPAKAADVPKVYQTIAAEVSRSEVWPLRMPVTPQGINPKACTISQNDPKVTLEPNRAAHSGGFSGLTPAELAAMSAVTGTGKGGGSKPKNTADLSTYTYDEVFLSGTFDLGQNVPYRLIPAVVKSKGSKGAFGNSGSNLPSAPNSSAGGAIGAAFGSSGQASGSGQPMIDVSTVDQVTFKNVFVDWGDGTLEPFHGKPTDSLYASGNTYYSSYVVNAGEYRHTYSRAAKYRVKVFVLSDEDMVRKDIVSEVGQALTPTQSAQGLFTRLSEAMQPIKPLVPMTGSGASGIKLTPLAARGGKAAPSTDKASAPAFGSHLGEFLDPRPTAAQAMARAYVVYCFDFEVYNRTDPCILVPVHLDSVHLEFPKDDSPESRKVKLPGASQNPKVLQAGPVPSLKPKAPELPSSASRPSLASQTAVAAGKAGAASQASVAMGAHPTVAAPESAGPNPPSTTTCNLLYSVTTRIKYYGRGTVRVIWKVDERQVGSRDVKVQSPMRLGLTEAEAKSCQNPLLGEEVMPSPALPVDSLGRHIATVEAYVLPEQSFDFSIDELASLTDLAQGNALQKPLSPRATHALADTLGKRGSGKQPVHLGLLNPSQAPGQPAYVSLHQLPNLASNAHLQRAANGQLVDSAHLLPPYRVETRGVYEVKAAKDGAICNLFFPTKGGLFPVTNLGSNLKLIPEGDLQRASGKGNLVLNLRAGTALDSVVPYPVEVKFSDWKVDGVTVVKGALDVNPSMAYKAPCAVGTLQRVRGSITDKNAPQDLFVTLKLNPIDTSMLMDTLGSPRPEWVSEAPITIHGDWIGRKNPGGSPLKLDPTKLGPTPWVFSAENVVIDLSSTEGADPKGGKTPDWVGISLGTVTLKPIVIEQGGQWIKPLPHPTNWTIEGFGVKGTADIGPWQLDYRTVGHMYVGNIHFSGSGDSGNYSVKYKDVEIRSPWFKDPIKGNASLVPTDGYKLDLDELNVASRPTLAGGPLAVDASNLQVIPIKNGGWVMQGRAHITLKAEGKALTAFDVDRVGFGLDGLLYFGDEGNRNTTVTLNRASSLGFTPADLQTVALAGGATKENPLSLQVSAKLRLSDNPVIPSAPVTMDYSLKGTGVPGAYTAPDVKVSPFSMDVAFPLGSPSMKAKINTNYQPGGTAGGAPAMASNRFSGEVDLSMFGGTPVKAQFVLGYDKGKDYFATRVDVPVGPSGTPIIPEIIHLYRLSGGFAYNFGKEVFKDGGSITDAKPDFKGETLFMAGARVGSGDGFVYTLDGQLVIRSSGNARMDFSAWMLAHNPSGSAPLHGCLEYSGGNFDGRIWGGFSFLDNMVALDLGASEQSAACSLHFGSGNWHIYAGNRDGQRISGTLLGNSSNVYVMLGSDVGLAVGGGSTWYMGAGVGVKAYAKGWMDMGLQITPAPKIIGDFGAGLEAGVCAFGHCVSAGVGASVHAEALPISLSASCCVDLPWPLSDICFTVKM
jgi:hypothetical protein